ncbi:MAG: RsmD family RNA methyltransferase [Muribaculaceae bacterium]|nr:16S rRNA (guanine(966)-N(2))-methyltransferase RsmD [Bacteroidales bacterium]MBD5327316.1 16S rRNA (guanine(966)-N(2))-methyltransferase RsmD [Bacteroides sp.]MBD5415904.1 16S rRNA (guanine(966)-N(2))-methyltransferase RsmD [Bacteroides sp.]MDE6223460.1 RsmD family RNA methyltransferase [Muribaculaceae bacterium]MDE6228478.1 RsmD family RNA methyltransferase [Muribaculaceae bacterium]
MRIIRGKFGRRRFDVPTNITARPTTDFARENIFNVLDNYLDFDGITAIDLFAGTGAISLELVSRGAASVVAVEKAPTQFRFIEKVRQQLNCNELTVVRGDALKYIESTVSPVGFIFADPPYDMENFECVPETILSSGACGEETIVVVEHSKKQDFSHLPEFRQHRAYGSVNFSIFCKTEL